MQDDEVPSPKSVETPPAVNLSAAVAFLDLLGSEGAHTFQSFGEGRDAAHPALARVVYGTFAQHRRQLEDLNRAGAGIFVMVNAGDGIVKAGARTCRTAANVTRVRALFVDLDGAPIRPVLICSVPPDWVVQSSPGHWHAYWRVADCPLDKFSAAQAALATKFGGDPTVKDLPRVMRTPGFIHQKRDPFTSRLYLPIDYSLLRETCGG